MRQPIVKGTTVKATFTQYDQYVNVTTAVGVAGTGYDSTHTIFTLPNGGVYDGTTTALQVFCNEAQWDSGVHFNYQNKTNATYITTLTAIPQNSSIRFKMTY